MIRIIKNNKGMTITEVILALAILGIVSIPLIAVFSNSIFLTQLTKRKMEINAVMQIAKGDVTQSVKNGSKLPDFIDPIDDSKKVNLKLNLDSALLDPIYNDPTKYFKMQGDHDLLNAYKYKVKYVSKDTVAPNIVELIIKLYSSDGKFLSELKTDIQYN